jgi:hypothetical protein
MQPRRRTPEMQFLGNRDEIAQVAQFHSHSPDEPTAPRSGCSGLTLLFTKREAFVPYRNAILKKWRAGNLNKSRGKPPHASRFHDLD